MVCNTTSRESEFVAGVRSLLSFFEEGNTVETAIYSIQVKNPLVFGKRSAQFIPSV